MPATIVTSCLSQSSQSQFDPRGVWHKPGGLHNEPKTIRHPRGIFRLVRPGLTKNNQTITTSRFIDTGMPDHTMGGKGRGRQNLMLEGGAAGATHICEHICIYIYIYIYIFYSLRDAPLAHQRVARSFGRSLRRSLDRSLGRSIARSLGRSLGRSIARSLDRSVVRSVARSVDRSVDRSLDRSVARPVARSLDRLSGNSGRAVRNSFQIVISGDSRSQPIYAAPRFLIDSWASVKLIVFGWLLAGRFPEKIMIACSRRNLQI